MTDENHGYSLAERIIRDLRNIFNRYDDILEFDIIPVDKQLFNKCPVVHIEQRVGLESWCVKHIYKYAYSKLITFKLSGNQSYPPEVIDWTFALLLVNPDLGLAWITRKELILAKKLSIRDELRLSEIILSRKPKSPDNFAHREWLLTELLKTLPNQETIDELARTELRVSLYTASKYQRNYYAWAHRVWVLTTLCKNRHDFVQYDLHLTKHWVENHISDYSGFHYRQTLLSSFQRNVSLGFDIDESLENMLNAELEMLNNQISLYVDRESLFCHRRFVLSKLATWFPLRVAIVQDAEKKFIDSQLFHTKSNSESCSWQLELLGRHLTWVKNVLKWDILPVDNAFYDDYFQKKNVPKS